jgi:RecB family endonuclease NucS
MTTIDETAIRKSLAKQLEVLEPGLRLIEEEHHLPNYLGGKGYVDIWAKDAQGMHVIIELKRSDSAARSALNEVFKYVALFRMNHGVPAHRIR